MRVGPKSDQGHGLDDSGPRLIPTLDELAAQPERAVGLPAEEVRRMPLRCAAVIAALAGCTPPVEVHEVSSSAPAADRLLRVPEAAELLGFASSYVYEMIRRGEFPAVRRGRYVRVRRSVLKDWIERKELDVAKHRA